VKKQEYFFASVWQTETEEMKKERVATYSAFLYVWYEAYVATKYDIACCWWCNSKINELHL